MMKTAMTTALTEEQLSRIPSDASLPSPALCMKLVLAGDLALERKQSPIELNEELKQNEALQRFFDGRSLCRTVAFEHPGYVVTSAYFDRLPSGRWQLRRIWEEIDEYHGRVRTVDHGVSWCVIPGRMFRGGYGKFVSDVCAAYSGLDGRTFFTQHELLDSAELRDLFERGL